MGFVFCSQMKPKKIYYILIFLAIVLFWGLSYYEAADTPGYLNKYNYDIQSFKGSIDRQFEIGYTLLAMLFKTLGLDYWVFQLVVFAIEIWLIIKGLQQFFDDRSLMTILPLLFFIYPNNLAAFRQGIAISIFIYALHYISDKDSQKSLRFFIFIFIASFFHQSAIFLVVVYCARFAKKNIVSAWVIFSILIVADLIWLIGGSLVTQLDFLIPFFRGDTLDMGRKYANMIEGDNLDTYGVAKVLEMNVAVVLYTLFCKKDKDSELMLFNLMLYVVIGLDLGGEVTHRLNYYWTIPYYVCLIRGIMALFRYHELSKWSYLAFAAYMFWFFIFKSGFIERDYIFLFGF